MDVEAEEHDGDAGELTVQAVPHFFWLVIWRALYMEPAHQSGHGFCVEASSRSIQRATHEIRHHKLKHEEGGGAEYYTQSFNS